MTKSKSKWFWFCFGVNYAIGVADDGKRWPAQQSIHRQSWGVAPGIGDETPAEAEVADEEAAEEEEEEPTPFSKLEAQLQSQKEEADRLIKKVRRVFLLSPPRIHPLPWAFVRSACAVTRMDYSSACRQ